MARIMKAVRKAVKYVKRGLKRRLTTKGGKKGKRGLDFGAVVRDVSYLKTVLNCEKKRISLTTTDNNLTLGQVNANGSGHIFQDITPIIPQGSGASQRNGASVKLHSAIMKFQLQQSSSTSSPVSGRMYLIKVPGSPVSTSDLSEFIVYNKFLFNQNAGTVIYDTRSFRNQDFFKDWVVLATKSFYLRNDNLSGQTMIKDITVPVRFKSHHLKYNVDSTTLANGQLWMLWVADSGNASGVSGSTLSGISQTGINTGLVMRYDMTFWYYDN